ncbi:hypothetical protein V493_07234 [Pseudogymnoascus sp. VKM F-4281 (FW-2241)]|nr:hypothetical protein V493_07234 [Pseudogymnoascus sp. VKM F-4281 (FW-2241)]
MSEEKKQGEIALETWETLYKDKDHSPTVLANMPEEKSQGETALEIWENLYKDKDHSPTVLVHQIIEYHEEINQENLKRLQTELNDVYALSEQQATKIKDMEKAAKRLTNGPSKVTVGASSKLVPPQDSSKETWDATINNIGATIHLLQAEDLYGEGDMKGLISVAENAVTCAGKQLDRKLFGEAWIWLGTGYSCSDNLKSGVQAFKRALEALETLNSKDKDVKWMKSLIYMWQSDIKEPEAKFAALLLEMQKR